MPLFGIAGERIAYEVTPGPVGARPIVLIHGFTASRASFLSNIPGLARRFTVVAVELLGHGDSDAPAEAARYGPGPAVSRLVGLLDELGYDKVLLCGHSLGAALALRLALDAPDRVAGLIILNSNSAAGSPAWREAARPNMAQMAASIREHGVGFMKETRLYPGHSKRLPAEARDALIADFERARPDGFAGTAEGLVIDVNAWERMPELSVPTLVVVGDRDVDFVKNAPAFVQRLPAHLVETFTIEGAGHAANLERPALFDAAVIGFAEGIGYIAIPPFEPPPAKAHAGGLLLGVLGGAMVAGGVALLVTAILVGRQASSTISAEPAAQATAVGTAVRPQPVIDTVSGARTGGPADTNAGATTAQPTASLAPAATPTPGNAVSATPTAAFALETATAPAPTATPTPTATPPPTATPTPAGPYAAIAGPATVSQGGTATFIDVSQPAHFKTEWTYLGQTIPAVPYVVVKFPGTPGCYTVALKVYFATPATTKTVTMTVAVGVPSCP
jgi:pimeloyl-ACP methyl ester carboxylesterase